MRVRTGRNLSRYPLPAAMTKQDRLDMEKDMYNSVFDKVIANKAYKGKYHTLTPESEWIGADKDRVEFLTADRYIHCSILLLVLVNIN